MMRNIVEYILLVLISISVSVLAGSTASSQTSDESITSVREVPAEIERYLYANPEGYYEVPKDSEWNMDQMSSEDTLGEVIVYSPQQASALIYGDGYAGSEWIDAQVIEGFIDGMSLPRQDEMAVSDYKGLLARIAYISPERASRAKVEKAFYIMAEKGDYLEDCRRVLDFASRRVQGDICSSADALGRSSSASKDLIKQQSLFLNRIRFKANLSMAPDRPDGSGLTT